MCLPCDISPLCFANSQTCGAQRCHLSHVTFVQPLLAKCWTNLDMSPKYVCHFSTKPAENNWKFLCTGKAWLILATWHQKVQMTQNWTCHLCALNSRHVVCLWSYVHWCVCDRACHTVRQTDWSYVHWCVCDRACHTVRWSLMRACGMSGRVLVPRTRWPCWSWTTVHSFLMRR